MAQKPHERMKVLMAIVIGIMLGFFIGVSVPSTLFMKPYATSLPNCPFTGSKLSTDDTRNVSANDALNVPANDTQNDSANTTQHYSANTTQYVSPDDVQLVSSNATQDVSANATQDVSADDAQLISANATQDVPADDAQLISANATQDVSDIATQLALDNITRDNVAELFNNSQTLVNKSKIWVPSNPEGAESLPPGIVVSESDFYLRRLWGLPSEDLTKVPKYLVTFTVGYEQRNNIDAALKKFSDNFTVVLFHYDGRVSEWDEFEWSREVIHISARKQTKWWYAKRFLHPDIVAAYDYIFIWDEDLGIEHFDAEEYIKLVKKHGLEISQPGLEPTKTMPWQMTKRQDDHEVHKETKERPGMCHDPHMPPCAAFVEIMAPVFSRKAWRCAWYLIQNDLVHGWGLDFSLQRCVERPAHERIGVVDAQWVVHQIVPSLGSQGEATNGAPSWRGVRLRCEREWKMFNARIINADRAYYESIEK